MEYKPQLVLISAGFDIHYDDPLGGMEVTRKGFSRLTQILMEIAEATAQGKLVITLEGGYSVSGQCQSVKAVLKELLSQTHLWIKKNNEKEGDLIPGWNSPSFKSKRFRNATGKVFRKLPSLTISFSSFPTLKKGSFFGGTSTISPVLGFRPLYPP